MTRSIRTLDRLCLGFILGASLSGFLPVHAQEPVVPGRMIVGMVQNQDLRRAPQATVEVKDQEGTLVGTAVANDAGEFSVEIRDKGRGAGRFSERIRHHHGRR